MALSLALAATEPPQENETPLAGNTLPDGSGVVCFDFWSGSRMRIVGTNGRRMVITRLAVEGTPTCGKFLMSLSAAREVLELFAAEGAPVSLTFFGLEQMILTSEADALIVDGVGGTYPGYTGLLEGDALPTRGGTYDAGTLLWVLKHAGTQHVNVVITAYGPTLIRPQLREDLQHIEEIIFAFKPLRLN